MIRSLSLRSRCAAASKRASAEPAAAPVDRVLPVLERELVERDPVERELLRVERPRLLVLLEPEDFADEEREDVARVRRALLPEPDVPEPPLLACGMLSPSDGLGHCVDPTVEGASVEALSDTRRICANS